MCELKLSPIMTRQVATTAIVTADSTSEIECADVDDINDVGANECLVMIWWKRLGLAYYCAILIP